MFGTVLENVVMDADTHVRSTSMTASHDGEHAGAPIRSGLRFPMRRPTGVTGAPDPNIVIMLTADAFGVLPPLARLTPEQAIYHFLSGYTAKVAGTERGLGKEPQATFSTCFGAPFMPRHPSVYARMLRERIEETGASCWLVNTGWTGGAFGTGERMRIAYTRALLRAALDGELEKVPLSRDNLFGLAVPEACPGVPQEVLNPRGTWQDKGAYDTTARDLVGRFHDNFTQFEEHVGDEVMAAAPKAA